MDLSNHPAIMVLSIAVVSSLFSEIRIGVRIPVAVWEILLGMILGAPQFLVSPASHTGNCGAGSLLRGSRRSCSWRAWISTSDGFEAGRWNSPGWVAPVAWTGTVSGSDSLGAEHRPSTVDRCTDRLDDRSRHHHSQSAGLGNLEHASGNPPACCRFDRRVWTHPRYIFAPDPQVRRVVAAYGPGWLHRARGGLSADRRESENSGNPAVAHARYAIEQPIAGVPVAVDRRLVCSDCGKHWLRGRRRVLFRRNGHWPRDLRQKRRPGVI